MYTNGLARRIERLRADPPPCEECGVDPHAPVAGFEVEWSDAIEPDEPEHCEMCGRADRIVITWDFADKGEGDT